jgi:hypothetical protein
MTRIGDLKKKNLIFNVWSISFADFCGNIQDTAPFLHNDLRERRFVSILKVLIAVTLAARSHSARRSRLPKVEEQSLSCLMLGIFGFSCDRKGRVESDSWPNLDLKGDNALAKVWLCDLLTCNNFRERFALHGSGIG